MADASYAIGNFLGGEISSFAQGRFDKPDYKTSLKTCRNSFPVESGAHVRRPGTRNAGTTLNGLPGRVIAFDFTQSSPFTCEYTDGNVRFRAGTTILGGSPLATPYVNGNWANLRAVQAETTQILLNPTIPPQALTFGTAFALAPAIFNDGPYLDPFINGVQAVPSAKTGIITLDLQFPAYSASTAYAAGSFITSGSVNYISLIDQNVGNTPASSPSAWQATTAGAAINSGKGFLGSDIGRSVRLLSEPPDFVAGTTYTTSSIVSYNPSGFAGGTTYWQSLVDDAVPVAPGQDITIWELMPQGAAIWTWGKITALSNVIDHALAGSTNFGNMTGGGGNNGAFNGTISQTSSGSAILTASGTGFFTPAQQITNTAYVGKNYTGASNQAIQHATIYPSSDQGFTFGSLVGSNGLSYAASPPSVTFNLRGKASAPASSSDGTLLGTAGPLSGASLSTAVSITSNDQVTAWKFVWIEMIAVNTFGGSITYTAYAFSDVIGQVSFFSPTGTGTGAGVSIEILGPALLYTTAIKTWRLGAYSATTGYPTCGVYHDGRLYLGGAINNRFDACYSNGIVGGTINMAPTDQYGAVTAAHAISYTFNAKSVNPIFWMRPDLQGVKAGTQAGEWLIQAPTAGPISPLNISARNVTNHGSANIEPADTEHTMIFVQRFARKLLEYFPDVFSGKFSAPNLADKAAHLTRAGVAELAYTSAVTPIIWGRCADGSWFGITYKRDSLASSQPPTFYGWHGHTLGSGRVVESICAGASVGGNLDALTMVTNDPKTDVRHVEILTDVQDELTPLAASWYLDDAVLPTLAAGSTSAVLSGLPYPDGSVVQVFCAGLDCGDVGKGAPGDGPFTDFTVTSGSITVPYGDGILLNGAGPGRGLFTQAAAIAASAAGQLIVGFTYNSDGQLVRPMTQAETGARNGPAFAKPSRGHRYGMKLVNTVALRIGGSFATLKPAALKKPNSPSNIDTGTTFSGIAFGELNDDYDYEGGTPAWRVARPFPANVVIIGSNLATQDE
jgi:hypothetical protein